MVRKLNTYDSKVVKMFNLMREIKSKQLLRRCNLSYLIKVLALNRKVKKKRH